MPRSCSPSNGYFVSCECYPDKEALRSLCKTEQPLSPSRLGPVQPDGLHAAPAPLHPTARSSPACPHLRSLCTALWSPSFPQAPPQHTRSTPNMTPPMEEAKRMSPAGPHLHLPQVSLGAWASPSPGTWNTGHSRWKHRPQGPSPRQAPTPALSQGPEK